MRLWGIIVTTLSVVLTLSGCAAEPAQISDRAVGDCWEISAGAAQEFYLNEGQNSVSCGTSTISVTYFVGEVQDAPADSYLSELFLEAKQIDDLPDSMHQDLINECQQSLKDLLSFENLGQLRQSRIVWDFTLPSHDQWNSGQRWFSCEMSILEKGSLLVEPVWAALPEGLDTIKSLASYSDDLTLCFDTATNSQLPSSSFGIVASCKDARWKLQPIALDNGYGEFYPGTKDATEIARNICTEKYPTAKATYASPVTEQDWNSPQPTIQCWYSTKEDPTSPEELAAEEARIAAEQQALAETAARQAAANRAWREYLAQQGAQNQPQQTGNSGSDTEPQPEQTTEPQPEQTSEPQPEQTSEPQPEQTSEPQPEQTSEPQPEQTSEPQPEPEL